MRQRIFLLVVLALTLPLPLSGQDVTGSIRGRAMSASGEGEPGVEVVVSGARLPNPRNTFTDRDGFFLVVGVPDGEYGLELSRLGLRTVSVEGVEVEIGRTTSVGTVTLEPRPLNFEPLVVAAPRSTVDPVHATVGANLDAADYETLPTGRDYRELLTVLPHANESPRGDAVNVGGSTGLDNQYFIDGVNVTSPYDATPGTSLPYNFVRTVELKEGGFEAQYGKALGAVVNAVTWTGTNEFEGQAFAFAAPGGLSATPRPTSGLKGSDPLTYDVGGRLSGPVLRGRLWYSAAFNTRIERVDKEIVGVGPYADRNRSDRFAGKLTWAASPTATVEVSAFGDPTTHHRVWVNYLRDPIGGEAGPFLHYTTSGSITGLLRGNLTLGSRLLLEGTLAHTSGHRSDRNESSALHETPMFWDAGSNVVSGGTGEWETMDYSRQTVRLRATWSPDRHTVIGGAEYEDNGVFKDYWAEVMADYGAIYYRDNESGVGTVHNRAPTLYLQDAWRVTDRLTLSPGLRWSGQFLIGASGATAQTFTDQWQPRLGFNWLLGSDDRQRLFGSYGRFYEQSPLYVASSYYLDYMILIRYYLQDPRVASAVAVVTEDWSRREADFARQIPGAQLDNMSEFTLGYQHTLGTDTRVTVRGIYSMLHSAFGYARNDSGQFVLGTPGKGDLAFVPSPRREYRALELSADGGLGALRYRASYVLSRTWGNYPGSFAADQGEAVPGQFLSLFSPWQAENTTGPLPQDRTHVFKLTGVYPTGLGLTAGAFVTLASGVPLNEFGRTIRTPSFLVPRGSAGRTPWTWDVNLRFTYEPRFVPAGTRIVMDLMHVGNPQRPVWLDEWHYVGWDPVTQQNIDPNPNYLQPIAYQPPAAMRVGMEVRF